MLISAAILTQDAQELTSSTSAERHAEAGEQRRGLLCVCICQQKCFWWGTPSGGRGHVGGD